VQRNSEEACLYGSSEVYSFPLLTENSAPFFTRMFLKVSNVSFFSARKIINSAVIISERL
jgi:hypothetical protein